METTELIKDVLASWGITDLTVGDDPEQGLHSSRCSHQGCTCASELAQAIADELS